MPSVRINAEDIFYERHGAGMGAPLVFVHGAGNTHDAWSKQLAALQNCTAYALDLPGHGQSTGAGRDNVAGYAEVLLGFLDGMLLASAVIAGHSLGGAIALWLAVHKPARVRGLVLVSTGARLRVHPNMLRAARDGRPITRAVLDEQPPAERPTLEAQAGANVTYGDWLACDRFDLMDRVHEVVAPTLVVAGANDWRTPAKYSQFFMDQIKGAKLVTVEGAGHNPMQEKPDEVNQAIQAFVNALPIVPPQKQ